jgi:hypothetical protein
VYIGGDLGSHGAIDPKEIEYTAGGVERNLHAHLVRVAQVDRHGHHRTMVDSRRSKLASDADGCVFLVRAEMALDVANVRLKATLGECVAPRKAPDDRE